MSEMVERIKALLKGNMREGFLDEETEELAKEVIAAMREPTEKMLKVGASLDCDERGNPGSEAVAEGLWEAMIDAALADE